MTLSLSTIDTSTDVTANVVTKLNAVINAMSSEVLTTNTTYGSVTGNVFLTGIFGSTTLVAPAVIRGGNVQSSATLIVSSNLSQNTFTYSVGSATVNSTLNSISFSTQNSTVDSNLLRNSLSIGVVNVSQVSINVASSKVNSSITVDNEISIENSEITNTSFNIFNSNTVLNDTTIVTNILQSNQVSLNSNVVINTSQISVNTAIINSSSLYIEDDGNISLTLPAANSSKFLNANGNFNEIILNNIDIGNSTVNAVSNSLSFTLSNSTVSFTLEKPTAAQVNLGSYYLNANGSYHNPNDPALLSYKNMIINGSMEVAIENGGSESKVNSLFEYYPVEQMKFSTNATSGLVVYQSTFAPDNYYNSVACEHRVNTTSNTNNYQEDSLYHYFEGTFFRQLGWGTSTPQDLTVGFWIYCTSPLTFNVSMRSSRTNQAYIKSNTITGNTWNWISYVVPGTTVNWGNAFVGNSEHTATLQLRYNTYTGLRDNTKLEEWTSSTEISDESTINLRDLGIGNTIYTTGWVAIPGSHEILAADAWKTKKYYDDEERSTQRYYVERNFADRSWVQSSSNKECGFNLPVQMRADPANSGVASDLYTITLNTHSISPAVVSNTHFSIEMLKGTNAQMYYVRGRYFANARLF